MEEYELTLLFSIRDDHYQSGNEAVRQVLQKLDGKIAKEEDMGERPLAYPVQKQEHGHYLFWAVKLPMQRVTELKAAIQENTSVLKFLMIKK